MEQQIVNIVSFVDRLLVFAPSLKEAPEYAAFQQRALACWKGISEGTLSESDVRFLDQAALDLAALAPK